MKTLLIILGCISLALGTLGIAIPLLPTTPFLLLSATLFVHSSPRLYDWLIKSPILGRYIVDYRENRSIPLRAKLTSITILWGSILYCIIFIADEKLWLQIILALIAVAVTWHILSLGTTKR
ncbi:MAG: YbaN family protein [Rikenellaceae bacterium]